MSGTGDKPNGVRGSFCFPASSRLLKHAAFDRVYKEGARVFSGNMTVFFRLREPGEGASGPRVGFTVSRAMGGAVVRNRIKRRLRAAVRQHLAGFKTTADVVINPKRTTAAADFTQLTVEVQRAFSQIQRRAQTSNAADAKGAEVRGSAKPAEAHKGSPA